MDIRFLARKWLFLLENQQLRSTSRMPIGAVLRWFAIIAILPIGYVPISVAPELFAVEPAHPSDIHNVRSNQELLLQRLPVDVATHPNDRWLVTANQGSGSVSLISTASMKVVDEIQCGDHCVDIAFSPNGERIVVSCAWSGELVELRIDEQGSRARLVRVRSTRIGFHPWGVAIGPDNKNVYVALRASGEVVRVDLDKQTIEERVHVGKWPTFLALSAKQGRLAVGCSGDSHIAVVDTSSDALEVAYEVSLANGVNLGRMVISPDDQYAYFTWMVYRTNPISTRNIRLGWVLATRIGRVRLDRKAYREAMSLDVPGKAIGDPYGIVITDNGSGNHQSTTILATAGGTHELLVYRGDDLPFIGTGGPGDLIDRRLQNDPERFSRYPLGGRPLGITLSADKQLAYIANHLQDQIQCFDIQSQQLIGTIDLSPKPTNLNPNEHLVQLGRELFYDATRSLDQWYSCHSCHQDGGTNSRPMDTMNDGTEMTFKTVLPLHHVTKTAPWTWHGWQTSLEESIKNSFEKTMIGHRPTVEETHAVIAYLASIQPPPNPHLNSLARDIVERGEKLFHSASTACIDCHHGPQFTDNDVHDVGLGSPKDVYDGYNTPTLIGVAQKVRWMHHGRAKSLEQVLTEFHSPKQVSGLDELTPQQVADLVAYLKSL